MPELFEHALSLSDGVELEVNHHEVRVRDGTMNMVSPNPGRFPVDGVIVERTFPSVEIRNGVLNPQDWHGYSLAGISAMRDCIDATLGLRFRHCDGEMTTGRRLFLRLSHAHERV
jgi:hypothetical protein